MNGPMLFDQVQRTIQSGGSGSLFVDVAAVVVAALVGGGQIWAIWSGIRRMQDASAERDKQLRKDAEERDRQFQQQAADSERRHQESMRALEALIERTAPPPLGGATG